LVLYLARFGLLGACTPDSLRSLGVAPVRAVRCFARTRIFRGGAGSEGDAQDGCGGHSAFTEERGVGVGAREKEFAQDGDGFGAGGLQEVGEVERHDGGG